ncbi:hypothetical protein ISS40_01015 [Candidatus Bathyarchaeota archaeon]|nr:hypothetical protein [Candidatus Bathyarchaeota archaeon]
MNPEEVASQLHENERRVLISLKDRGSATTVELSALTGLSRDAVEMARENMNEAGPARDRRR